MNNIAYISGALLLFSEDYAARWHRRFEEEQPRNLTSDDINLRTCGDLAKSILSYGSVSTFLSISKIKNDQFIFGIKQ